MKRQHDNTGAPLQGGVEDLFDLLFCFIVFFKSCFIPKERFSPLYFKPLYIFTTYLVNKLNYKIHYPTFCPNQ
jgi:hypothetical protein